MTVDRGDPQRPEIRCRLEAQATKMQGTIAAGDIGAVFSATPPLEMHAVVGNLEVKQNFVFRLVDISRAHSHCVIARKVFIRLLEEGPGSPE